MQLDHLRGHLPLVVGAKHLPGHLPERAARRHAEIEIVFGGGEEHLALGPWASTNPEGQRRPRAIELERRREPPPWTHRGPIGGRAEYAPGLSDNMRRGGFGIVSAHQPDDAL
jgi:hypothetical protein